MDPGMFFHPVGPGSPRLIGPVGGDFAGFWNTPPDPSMQLRIDLQRAPRERDLRRQIAVSKAFSKKSKRLKPTSVLRPRHKEITTVVPLRVGDEHGKPASPRDLERRDAFDALEYSSPRYLLEEKHSPRKLPNHITRGKQFEGANEALEGLEDTFMMPLEPCSSK